MPLTRSARKRLQEKNPSSDWLISEMQISMDFGKIDDSQQQQKQDDTEMFDNDFILEDETQQNSKQKKSKKLKKEDDGSDEDFMCSEIELWEQQKESMIASVFEESDSEDEKPLRKRMRVKRTPTKNKDKKGSNSLFQVPVTLSSKVTESDADRIQPDIPVASTNEVSRHINLINNDDDSEAEEEVNIFPKLHLLDCLSELAQFSQKQEPSTELLIELLPYQKVFLAWGIMQEQNERIGGGILADEMGMGKTLQLISLILAHREDGKINTADQEMLRGGSNKVQSRFLMQQKQNTQSFQMKLPAAATSDRTSRSPLQPASINDQEISQTRVNETEKQPPVDQVPAQNIQRQDRSVLDILNELSGGKCWHGNKCKCDKVPVDVKQQKQGEFAKTTLVVCPLVAMIQWKAEIQKCVQPGALTVLEYYGDKRKRVTAEELVGYDVVLTTYGTLQSDFSKASSPSKATCLYCNKKYLCGTLFVHLMYHCGPYAQRTEAQSRTEKTKVKNVNTRKFMQKYMKDCKKQQKEKEHEEKASSPKTTGKRKRRNSKDKEQEHQGNRIRVVEHEGTTVELEFLEEQGDLDLIGQFLEIIPTDRLLEIHKESRFLPGDYSRIKRLTVLVEAEIMFQLGKEVAKQQSAKSVLHQVKFRRIVLDEAHSIKSKTTSTSKAVFELSSKYRWALSGTPMQNRTNELYSLIRFLQVYPYSHYYCTKPGCRCVHLEWKLPRRGGCPDCNHSRSHHVCWWNRFIANPITNPRDNPRRRESEVTQTSESSIKILKAEVLPAVLMRRTKVECADDLLLPPRTVELRYDSLDEREKDFYEGLYTRSVAQFGGYVDAGTVLNNYAHIFDLLIRLRQAVDHPYLVVYNQASQKPRNTAAEADENQPNSAYANQRQQLLENGAENEEELIGICEICKDGIQQPRTAACGHKFCFDCVMTHIQIAKAEDSCAKCPVCDEKLTINLSESANDVEINNDEEQEEGKTVVKSNSYVPDTYKNHEYLKKINLGMFQSSTKIEALREEIDKMLESDPSAKAIVFSQFKNMLDLIYYRLESKGIKTLSLTGQMSLDKRDQVLDQFAHDPNVPVLLMSLKAGGVALNVTAASMVMLMDPWWNPAVEQQAQDRIHRLGQHKPIKVIRFIIKGTIEERILKLQRKKQLIFEGTVGQDQDALARLSGDDMKFLFS
eukprot:TRINITY_DN13156_c0_g2_i1.p1 TRINITY_DN13156_c0_g2~~TRINITY_DN13156_c0_g2_i1.p1  ORF type:complete len:1217 (-),score=153.10 TRINITY_DN13156_c0_g2_i1:497-4033(-)